MKLPPEGELLIRQLREARDTDAWLARGPYQRRILWLERGRRESLEQCKQVMKALPNHRLKAGELVRLVEIIAPSLKWKFGVLDLVVEDARWIEYRLKRRGIVGALTPELLAAEAYLRVKYGKDGDGSLWEAERRQLADQVCKKLRHPSGTTGAERARRKAKRG